MYVTGEFVPMHTRTQLQSQHSIPPDATLIAYEVIALSSYILINNQQILICTYILAHSCSNVLHQLADFFNSQYFCSKQSVLLWLMQMFLHDR